MGDSWFDDVDTGTAVVPWLLVAYCRGRNDERVDRFVKAMEVGQVPAFVEEEDDPRGKRPQLSAAMQLLHDVASGTRPVLVLECWEDLGRSLPHLVSLVRQLLRRRGAVVVLKRFDEIEGVWAGDSGWLMDATGCECLQLSASELVTRLDDARAGMQSERIRAGLGRAAMKGPVGSGRKPKLDAQDRDRIIKARSEGVSAAALAHQFGVSATTVRRVWRARTSHVPTGNVTGRKEPGGGTSEEQRT